MANEFAAMETAPSGATMTVLAMCAPRIMTFCTHIGPVMPKAFLRHRAVGRKDPLSFTMASSLERTSRKYSIATAVTASASPVPSAAPRTPIPAPGTVTCAPRSVISLVGNISRKLKMTSSTHIITFSILGTFILPLHESILLPKNPSCIAGRNNT